MSLRARILLVVVAALLPLALLGLWLVGAAERSGEELLRARLEGSLREAVAAAGANWVRHRSALVDLAEVPAVRMALREGRPLPEPGAPEAPPELRAAWERLEGRFAEATLRDASGEPRGLLAGGAGEAPTVALVPVPLDVFDGPTGPRLGTLEGRLRLTELLADAAWWTRVGGSALVVLDPRTKAPLVPSPIAPELLLRDRFEWQGEAWLAVRHTLREPPLTLVLAAPVTPFQEPFERAARRGTLALALALAGAVVLATLLARRTSRALDEMAGAADAVARGDLARTVPEPGPEELRRLAGAFNAMTESLRRTMAELTRRESLAAVGEFAASLAHEIRNPLTSVRLDLQRALRRLPGDEDRRAGADAAPAGRLVEGALKEVDRLEATVSTALRLARSGRVERRPLDLRDPLREALWETEARFGSPGPALVPPALDVPLPVEGDADALEQLFRNLLENAAEAAGAGGRVRVRAEVEGGRVRVRIADDGPGIPPELRERIFEPLFSTRTGGTGLGLPVARRIAHAHGAELRLEEASGGGTEAVLDLPGA